MRNGINPPHLPSGQIYVSIMVSYLNLLAYFYVTFYATFLLPIIVDEY